MMDRCTISMRLKHFEFLWHSFIKSLCLALPCPEMTHVKDLKDRMP